jgi:hypothetical protein
MWFASCLLTITLSSSLFVWWVAARVTTLLSGNLVLMRSSYRMDLMVSITNINKEVIFHKMVFESRNLGPSASNSACGSTKNMSHRAGCDLRLRSRVASTTPKTCFLVQYRHCELRNFKNHDPRNRNREMIVSR